jgi:hypothetical protein
MPYRERLDHHWNHIFEKAHMKWGHLMNDLIKFPQNYDKELFFSSYVHEIWLSELHPPENVDTRILVEHVIDKNQKQFTESLVKMFPKVHDPERWWLELDNLSNAARFVLFTEHESLSLSEKFISQVNVCFFG